MADQTPVLKKLKGADGLAIAITHGNNDNTDPMDTSNEEKGSTSPQKQSNQEALREYFTSIFPQPVGEDDSKRNRTPTIPPKKEQEISDVAKSAILTQQRYICLRVCADKSTRLELLDPIANAFKPPVPVTEPIPSPSPTSATDPNQTPTAGPATPADDLPESNATPVATDATGAVVPNAGGETPAPVVPAKPANEGKKKKRMKHYQKALTRKPKKGWRGGQVDKKEEDKFDFTRPTLDGGLTVLGCKGYRMARATYGVGEGSEWFFEIKVNNHHKVQSKDFQMPSIRSTQAHTDEDYAPQVRIGFSTTKGYLEAPVGYDMYSYGYCSRNGKRTHQSKLESYGEPFGPGDVIGCYICLPPFEEREQLRQMKKDLKHNETTDHIQRLEQQLKHKSSMVADGESMHVLKGSRIQFYKNGVAQGPAFEDIFAATYFPAVSTYMNSSVTLNFGPNFDFPINFKPRDFNKFYINSPKSKQLLKQAGLETHMENGSTSFLIPERLVPNKKDIDLSQQLPKATPATLTT